MKFGLVLLSTAMLAACGGGGGGSDDSFRSGYAGTWNVAMNYAPVAGETSCFPSPQPIVMKVEVNQAGDAIVVDFPDGNVVVEKNATFEGDIRNEGNFVTGRVEKKVQCPNGQVGDNTNAFIFENTIGDTADAKQVFFVPCGSGQCRTIWEGKAVRQ